MANEATTIENERLARLNRARFSDRLKSEKFMSAEKKISNAEWGLMIFVALFYDLLNFLISLLHGIPIVGNISAIVFNRILTIWAWLTFFIWLKIKGENLRCKWIREMGGICEIIPFLSALPFWTGTIIAIMIVNKVKKVVPENLQKVVPKAI